MKLNLKGAAIAAVLALTACGGGDDSKDLFSLWKSEQTNAPLEFSNLKFGAGNRFTFFGSGGVNCSCDLSIVGDQDSGVLALENCRTVPYVVAREQQCKAQNGNSAYSKSRDVLTINQNGSISTYR